MPFCWVLSKFHLPKNQYHSNTNYWLVPTTIRGMVVFGIGGRDIQTLLNWVDIFRGTLALQIGISNGQGGDNGIDFFAVSWLGPHSWEENALKHGLLQARNLNYMRFCIFYESVLRMQNPPYTTTFISDVKYLANEFFNHPQYLKLEGKPVLILYFVNHLYMKLGEDAVTTIHQVRQELLDMGFDVYLVADVIDFPAFMLHPGRYNFAGVGVGTDPEKFTEGLAMPRGCALWIPDAVVTDHGFPHHEWVMFFSGYVPKAYPTYWINRGTVWLDATAYKSTIEPLLYKITIAQKKYQLDELTADDEIMEWIHICNEEYEKYGHQWLPGTFPVTKERGVIYYWRERDRDPSTRLDSETGVNRYLCPIDYYTEVSDELAWDNTMKICARTHFLVDLGVTKVLYEAEYEYIRTETEIDGAISLSLRRYRPFNADALVP